MSVCYTGIRYKITWVDLGDVGGQRTLRPYWRNYFEQTDAIVWVVDSRDRLRMQDCKEALHDLLQEDVSNCCLHSVPYSDRACLKRLIGASLLVFANKQDISGSMNEIDIRGASLKRLFIVDFTHASFLYRQALDLASINSHQWKILPCSAMTGENLVQGLDWVVNDIAHRLYYSTGPVQSTPVQLPSLVHS